MEKTNSSLTSIILPNLNTDLKFLTPRVQSILNQTTPWECIVIDGFSQNGSWEFLCDKVKGDPRFKLYQKPKLGIYNAWNEGIKLAKGHYIYIATSDDTMEPDFLKKMTSALDENQDCDIAHCCLTIINEEGAVDSTMSWNDFLPPQYFGQLIHQKHIRYAPHDGILHSFIKTVYHSVTQLLIRRRVFTELGYFLEDARSIADFEWGLRVSLVRNTIHVPEYLATWRCHPNQATQADIQSDPETYDTLIGWLESNLANARKASGAFSDCSTKDLTRVYQQNRRYFFSQQLKKRNPLIYKFYRKIFSAPSRYTNGVAEAKHYFKKNNLQRLLKPVEVT